MALAKRPFKWLPLRHTWLLALFLCGACSAPAPHVLPPAPPTKALPGDSSPDPIAGLLGTEQTTESSLPAMGYCTQVGAFGSLDNAVRLERSLDARGIDAYYFRDESGLYKVRFGNHPTYREARGEAERLRARGVIGAFFIVVPGDYPAARDRHGNQQQLRRALVKTARHFLGVPYRWGGTNAAAGFDCSGLTLVCYRLNGLDLPRVSRSQYRAGHRVDRDQLRKGDLVFFATHGGRRVTHVGIYIGGGKFIHAPRTGKTVRVANLDNPYFVRTFVGGRSYF